MQNLYADKPLDYYAGAATAMVEALNSDAGLVLEVGCGTGATRAWARTQGKGRRWVGIELDPEAAEQARHELDEVICADVERLSVEQFEGEFDALLMSEVLEHLVDPWAALARLVRCVKHGGQVLASSPNASHWRVVGQLAAGRFDYTPSGVMDRTHLRWFTPLTYREMFEAAGVEVIHVGPLSPPGLAGRLLAQLSRGQLAHLTTTQVFLRGRRRP
jgi:2-polyprenyl-3-methyl-5-hydroxy-6-metoxy-1,4-benzoquinol methylase